MDQVKYDAYSRGMQSYLPQILYGADAIPPKKEHVPLEAVPGGEIVKAY